MSSTLKPNETSERYIKFIKDDFELLDFVFDGGHLERVVHLSETDDGLLQRLESMGNYPQMMAYILKQGWDFVELRTYARQVYEHSFKRN